MADGAGVPSSGPVIVETQWLRPADTNDPAIVGAWDDGGCCYPDYAYANRDGPILGDPYSHPGGTISR